MILQRLEGLINDQMLYLSKYNIGLLTNISLQEVEDKTQLQISTSKIENRQTNQGLNSTFITNQSDLESEV